MGLVGPAVDFLIKLFKNPAVGWKARRFLSKRNPGNISNCLKQYAFVNRKAHDDRLKDGIISRSWRSDGEKHQPIAIDQLARLMEVGKSRPEYRPAPWKAPCRDGQKNSASHVSPATSTTGSRNAPPCQSVMSVEIFCISLTRARTISPSLASTYPPPAALE